MADLVDENLAQAGLLLLAADAGMSSFDGKVPDGTDPPYVLVYTTVAWQAGEAGTANAINAQSVTALVTWTCHCVGETAAAARAMQMRARAALLNQRPVVAGRSCGLIRQDEVLAPNRDETTGRLVMDGVSVFSMISAL